MDGLCKYKDILGKPNEGIHSVRVGGLAAFDVFATMFLSLAIYGYTKINPIYILIVLLIVGELLHYMFCVDTPIIRYFTNMWKPAK